MSKYKYVWPSSSLDETDMSKLFHIRNSLVPKRIPINKLIKKAVNEFCERNYQDLGLEFPNGNIPDEAA